MFQQMISVVQYCHQRGRVHRDLKPNNTLIDSEMNNKVADFGFSREFNDHKLSTFCGTVSSMAPEILQHQTYNSPMVDIWSLDVTFVQDGDGGCAILGTIFGN